MSGQHTPGPWSYWPKCVRDGGMITQDATARHIAAPTVIPVDGVTEANARLIAAAPELLEALRWAAQNADQSEAGRDDDWYAGLDRVRAAIAKAEGRS